MIAEHVTLWRSMISLTNPSSPRLQNTNDRHHLCLRSNYNLTYLQQQGLKKTVRVYELLKEAHNFTYDKCVLSSGRLQRLGPEIRNCDREFSYINFIYLR
jgi:hypothetical protein